MNIGRNSSLKSNIKGGVFNLQCGVNHDSIAREDANVKMTKAKESPDHLWPGHFSLNFELLLTP